jgi:hypothetical protein
MKYIGKIRSMRILQGRIQDFKLGGRALKKIAPSGGRRENCWGISCEKSRFYAKKSYFSNFRGGTQNFWGISCEKSRFYAKKKHIFSNFRGGVHRVCPPPPESAPGLYEDYNFKSCLKSFLMVLHLGCIPIFIKLM